MRTVAVLAVVLLAAAAVCNAQVDCGTNDVVYGGGDILVAGHHNIQLTPEDCQASCQCLPNCVHWSWFPEDSDTSSNYCLLKYELGIPLEYPGSQSGPREC